MTRDEIKESFLFQRSFIRKVGNFFLLQAISDLKPRGELGGGV